MKSSKKHVTHQDDQSMLAPTRGLRGMMVLAALSSLDATPKKTREDRWFRVHEWMNAASMEFLNLKASSLSSSSRSFSLCDDSSIRNSELHTDEGTKHQSHLLLRNSL